MNTGWKGNTFIALEITVVETKTVVDIKLPTITNILTYFANA
jgi:hypothetical protein